MSIWSRRSFPRARLAILAIVCGVGGIVAVVQAFGAPWHEPSPVPGEVVRYELLTRRGKFFTKSRRLELTVQGGGVYRYSDSMPRFDEVREGLSRTQLPVTILADGDRVHEIRLGGVPLVHKEEVQAALEDEHRLTIPLAVLFFAISGFSVWRYRVVDRRLAAARAEEPAPEASPAVPPPLPASSLSVATDAEFVADLSADLARLFERVAADDGFAPEHVRTYEERVARVRARDHADLESARQAIRFTDSTVLRYAIRWVEGEARETVVELAECSGGPAHRFRHVSGEWEPLAPGPNLVAG